ncbi:MAG TPA: hypothetical protein VNI84_17215 [Pyrinomonadaceae bacterium]|nr:hypothetical protein [Pyrinomonadaceae bacterium]
MKLWKKIILILFCALLLAQIPFAYRRFQKGKLAAKISNLDAQKKPPLNSQFDDYKGIIHVHTALGGHSTGSFKELIEAGRANNLDFVVMTEHTSELYDTAALTLQGVRQGVLFVGGSEANTKSDERFLILDGFPGAHSSKQIDTPEFLQRVRAENKLAFITYPEKFTSWDSDFDGIEVFSLYTNGKQMNVPFFLLDALWSFGAYPELTIADYFKRPDANLKKFDEITAARKSTLFAGSDAHSNLGAHLLGDDAGGKMINLKFDRYETLFRLVRTHVLLEKDKPLTRENLLGALEYGRTFIGFDVLGDTTGFSFTAENADESKTMGDEISAAENVILKVTAPQTARFVIFRNGENVFETGGDTKAEFRVSAPGAYRAEVYLDALGAPFDRMPWIISNPIYAR